MSRPNSEYRGFKKLVDVKAGELFYDYMAQNFFGKDW